MPQPNLFLIGAPKCCTSSLFDWLSQHPDIRGSKVKETFALIDPAHPLARRTGVAADSKDAYKRFFRQEDKDASFRMEGTTHYFYDDHALQAIAAIPGARVILALREPASRVYSSFRYTKNNLARLKVDMSFSDYLLLLKNQEPLYPRWCTHPGSAFVLERDIHYSRYQLFLSKWLSTMSPENIFVVLMEDMIRHPYSVVSEIVSWLNLRPIPESDLESAAKNTTIVVNSKNVHRIALMLSSMLPIPRQIKPGLKEIYSLVQFKNQSLPTPDDIESLQQLKKSFMRDNEILQAMTSIDISPWT